MKFGNTFKEICTPARVYFFISAITIVIGLFSGFQLLAVFMKIGFVLVWTYILNLLCKKGFKPLSWFLVVLPYFLILIGFLMTLGNVREGADTMADWYKSMNVKSAGVNYTPLTTTPQATAPAPGVAAANWNASMNTQAMAAQAMSGIKPYSGPFSSPSAAPPTGMNNQAPVSGNVMKNPAPVSGLGPKR